VNTFMDRVNGIVQQNQMPQRMMAAPQPEPSYPDAGMGALSTVVSGAPRQTMIANQPHMLAYINPQEKALIQSQRGGMPAFEGPGGVPAFWHGGDHWYSGAVNAVKDTFKEITSGGDAVTNTWNPTITTNDDPPYVAPVIDTNTSVNTTSPVNTGSTAINIGAVSNTGQYAGDGFEWQVTPGTNALTRTFTGAGSRQQADATNQGVGQGAGLTQAEQLAGYRDNTKNTFKEYLANTFTPGDNLAYKNGQLVYEKDHKDYDPSNEFKAVSPEERNSFNLRVGMGNSSVNDNPGESNYANYGEARAARQGSIPGIPSILGGIGAYLGGIRPEDEAVGYGANGEQIFKSGNGYFYVIDRNTGLVRNVQGANDSSNSEESMQRQREMMENRTSGDDNNAFNPQLGMPVEQAVNNPVIDNPYSLTPLKRAVTGIGSNVGSFYDTGNTVVESSTDPFAGAPQGGGALTFEELMRLNQQQNRII
jgi:hypothetical protein